jgi:hypothetical protein
VVLRLPRYRAKTQPDGILDTSVDAYFASVRRYVVFITFEMCNDEKIAMCSMREFRYIVPRCSHKTRKRSI